MRCHWSKMYRYGPALPVVLASAERFSFCKQLFNGCSYLMLLHAPTTGLVLVNISLHVLLHDKGAVLSRFVTIKLSCHKCHPQCSRQPMKSTSAGHDLVCCPVAGQARACNTAAPSTCAGARNDVRECE